MEKLKYKLIRFMQGRYGIDTLYYALIISSLIILLVNIFIRNILFNVLVWSIMTIAIYRSLSKNLHKRRIENAKFLKIWNKVKTRYRFLQRVMKGRKTHRFRTCPHCKATLRLRKKSGKMKVRCPKCHHIFQIRILW